MKNLLRLIIATLASQATVAQAFWGSGWLDFYECSDSHSAISCKGCSLKNGERIKLTTDSVKGIVAIQFQVKGIVAPPTALSACTILDKGNWSCNKKQSIGPTYHEVHEGMADGVYSRRFVLYDHHGKIMSQTNFCAK